MVDLIAAPPPAYAFQRPGCTLSPEPDLAIAKLRLIGEGEGRFAALVGSAAPPSRGWIAYAGLDLAWMAPGEWLATGAPAGIASLIARFADEPLGFALDISDGRFACRLAGPEARTAIASVSPLDVSDRAFPVGAAARSFLAETGMFIARLADGADGPQFRLIVDQTMVAHAQRMLSVATPRSHS